MNFVASADPLVVGKVIGDVLDMFIPSVAMSVEYGARQITNGCTIKPAVCVDTPLVIIGGHRQSLYTMVMTDPDAPSPSEPNLREWVHWIVTDIPGCTNSARGRELLPYLSPKPPVGIHRYVFALFEQKAAFKEEQLKEPNSRINFSTRTFANHMGLGPPVATVYFNSQKEPNSSSRRRR